MIECQLARLRELVLASLKPLPRGRNSRGRSNPARREQTVERPAYIGCKVNCKPDNYEDPAEN